MYKIMTHREESLKGDFAQIAGVNILHQRGELFPDEFAQKHLTLPYLLTKFWKMGNFSPMEYRGIIQNIHPWVGPQLGSYLYFYELFIVKSFFL